MGCSSSHVLTNEDNKKILIERNNYINRSEKLESLAQEILDDTIKMTNGTPEGIDKMIYFISSKKGTIAPMNQSEIREALSDLYVQQLLLSERIIKDIDIQSQVDDRFLNLNALPSDIKSNISILLQNFTVNYPKQQSCIAIDYDPQLQLEDPLLETSFFTNMKFNRSFQVDCLCFNLSNSILLKPSLCSKFAEVITCNKGLVTAVIQINADIEMNKDIDNLLPLFQALAKHKTIQMVIVISSKAKRFALGPMIEEAIVDLVRNSKTLIGLCLLKVCFSDMFLANMEKVLPYALSLRLLMIETSYENLRVLDDFVGRGIGRCSSLIAVLLAGLNLYETKKKEYGQIKALNGKLKLLEFLDELKYKLT